MFLYLSKTGFMNFILIISHPKYPIINPVIPPTKTSIKRLLLEINIDIKGLFVKNKWMTSPMAGNPNKVKIDSLINEFLFNF